MDISDLLYICLEYDLHNSMIQICTQYQDFVTPFIKIFGKYLQTESKDLGYRCLWYLKKCLV